MCPSHGYNLKFGSISLKGNLTRRNPLEKFPSKKSTRKIKAFKAMFNVFYSKKIKANHLFALSKNLR
jgi:hypothetical protein